MKTIVLLVLLVAIIAVASYFAVKRSKPAEEGLGYSAVMMCASPDCQKIFQGRVIVDRPPPYRCKHCGRKTAYRAVKCSNCGEIFPFVVQEDPSKPESEELVTEECPECYSRDFDLVENMDEVKEFLSRDE